MIRVTQQPEPDSFFDLVKKKADKFLKENPSPTIQEIRKRDLWTGALDDLYQSYGEVCAYSSLWYSRDAATVDHFIPIAVLKGEMVTLAYDWNNFRLASRSMNNEKLDFQDVIDPFLVEQGWFVMDFPSLMIRCGDDLPSSVSEKVNATIKRLKLNEKNRYINYRSKFLEEYCKQCKQYIKIYPDFIAAPLFNTLEKRAPFIAYELKRQGLEIKIIDMMLENSAIKGLS